MDYASYKGVSPVIRSRPGRIMIEKYDEQNRVIDRCYASHRAAEGLAAKGWTIYVPAAGGGWKLPPRA